MARLSVAYTIRSNFASDVLGSCEENMLKVFFYGMDMVLQSYLALIHVKYMFLIVQHKNVHHNCIKAFYLN